MRISAVSTVCSCFRTGSLLEVGGEPRQPQLACPQLRSPLGNRYPFTYGRNQAPGPRLVSCALQPGQAAGGAAPGAGPSLASGAGSSLNPGCRAGPA